MLRLKRSEREYFDEESETFVSLPATDIFLEHSLLAISKWESMWKTSFLNKKQLTTEEFLSYIECMCVDESSAKRIFELTNSDLSKITEYMNDPCTATKVFTLGGGRSGRNQIITSELIYYWMLCCNIPFECEKWHINRLFTLLQIHNAKNSPKKMTNSEALAFQREENERRKKLYGTSG